MGFGIKLRVWGEYACFTRPEMKAERVSYDAMTPSAARGILEAIHWKPALVWRIDRIHVMKPIRFESIRRNEVASKIPKGNIKTAMITLNLRLAEKPAECLRYVLTHELCHLHEAGHGEKFWKRMDVYYPDWKRVRKSLKQRT